LRGLLGAYEAVLARIAVVFEPFIHQVLDAFGRCFIDSSICTPTGNMSSCYSQCTLRRVTPLRSRESSGAPPG
jgi:hypothetical protein